MVLESDDVYMSTTFESFIHTLVTKSRGGGVVELEYDAVSVSTLTSIGGKGRPGYVSSPRDL